MEAARTLGFEGFNVTMPHKTNVVKFLDRLDKDAEEIGAVNTVARTSQGLVGFNTDGEGSMRAMREYAFHPQGKKILIIGAGGAARAIAHALSETAGVLTILNRSEMKAKDVVQSLRGEAKAVHGELTKASLGKAVSDCDLIVNATPLEASQLIGNLKSRVNEQLETPWVFDLSYERLRSGPGKRARNISPLEMLLQQAALAFEIWLGSKAPIDLMRKLLVDHLGVDWR